MISKRNLLLSAALFVSIFQGCQTVGPNTYGGGLLGGTTGALAGAAIGATDGKPLEGAAIGAAIGSTVGATAGNQVDRQIQRDRTEQAIANQQAVDRAVTFQQVAQMTANGLSEDVIINQVQATGVAARPSPNDLMWLKSNGVSDRVIVAMQQAPLAGSGSKGPFVAREGYPPPYAYEYQQWIPVRPCPPRYIRPYPRWRQCGPRAGFAVHF